MIAKLKVKCVCGKDNFIEVNPASMLGKKTASKYSKEEMRKRMSILGKKSAIKKQKTK